MPAVDQVRLARFYLDAAAPWQTLALLDALPPEDRSDPTVRRLRSRALADLGRPERDAGPPPRGGGVDGLVPAAR